MQKSMSLKSGQLARVLPKPSTRTPSLLRSIPQRVPTNKWNSPIEPAPGTTDREPEVKVKTRVEEARKYFRTVYDFPQWEKHRKQTRLIDRLLTIPQSHILTNILPSVYWVTGVSTMLCWYQAAYEQGAFPEGFLSVQVNPSAQSFVSTTSIALSLLLVFRTNTGYARWDEARKMWGGLLNRSRDLMRQGATVFPADDIEAKKALARWTIAFARVLRIHFQPEVTVDAELKDILEPAELIRLRDAPHRPVFALHCISQIIQNVGMSPMHQMQMSQNLTFFQDVLGGCERLLRAPIPVSYTRHTARFLFLWLTILPFSLYPSLGIWTIPTVFGISGVLCGIEEIGVQCEEPFGVLPLDVICNRIQADVMSTLKEDTDAKQLLFITMHRKERVSDICAKRSPVGSAYPVRSLDKASGLATIDIKPEDVVQVAGMGSMDSIDWNQVDYEQLLESERDLQRLEAELNSFSGKADKQLSEISKMLSNEPVRTNN
eukprot:gene6449-3080_t